MRNKKSLLSLGLLTLVLVLGVGYAVINEVPLAIDGTASVKSEALKVSLKSVEDTKPTGVSVEHTFEDGDIADTFTITDMKLNDTVKLVYTVQNKETDVDATLEEAVELSFTNDEYFDVTYTIDETSVPAGSSEATITVNVTLSKTPVVEANGTSEISFSVKAKAVNNADPQEEPTE